MPGSRPIRRFEWLAAAALALAVLAAPPAPAATVEERAAEAVELYNAGRYREAGQMLLALDAEGKADGPLLYRLHYCQRHAGQSQLGAETLQRAVDRLNADLGTAADRPTGGASGWSRDPGWRPSYPIAPDHRGAG